MSEEAGKSEAAAYLAAEAKRPKFAATAPAGLAATPQTAPATTSWDKAIAKVNEAFGK